jgi:hypothetical protein
MDIFKGMCEILIIFNKCSATKKRRLTQLEGEKKKIVKTPSSSFFLAMNNLKL